MPITYRTGDEAGFRAAVRSAVVGMGEGEVEVLDVAVTHFVNAVDQDAWEVELVLPRPRGETWDHDRSLLLRREVRRRTDELATRYDTEREGNTLVTLTTHDLRPEDVPLEEEPLEPGEGFAAPSRRGV